MRAMNQKGITLVELMVVVALSAIIGIAAMNMFTLSNRTFLDQNRVVDVQREGRLVMDYLAKVIREAGLNPQNASGFLSVRQFNLGEITVDRDDDLDGVLDDKEVVSFKRSPVAGGGFVLERGLSSGSPTTLQWHQIARNIENFQFEYYDASGGILAATADPEDIRSVDIILTFKDEKFAGGDFVRSYKRRVDLRNF